MDSSSSVQSVGEHASQIYPRMNEVYGEQCLARCTIFMWCGRFQAGRINIKDLPRFGQVHVVTNSATLSAVDELLWKNRRVTTSEIAVELSINKRNCASQKAWLWQSLCAVDASVGESEDGENGCSSAPAVSTLKPSTPFLRPGISVSMPIIHGCTVPHEL
ncbi:hypothetical protein AVEN_81956-1 [Araneus ventricosus]|uniref:Mos1 transposase HTH domain-containing protein n=1 Tax=Araneus ventricosus TaxID=182803 RepID=A0A4Y2ILT9_ARAVE|nr:hypothetical protein AVEN_81956-1 [Araneus ventricosus]